MKSVRLPLRLTACVVASLVLMTGTSVFAQRANNGSAQTQPTPPARTAQGQTPSVQDSSTDVDVFTRRVNLPISVLDKKGVPIAGLTQNDFLIFEDKQPQRIESFAIESSNLPLNVGVLMDMSASTAGKLAFQQESAMNFIYTVLRLRKDKAAFATFADDIQLRQDFTDKLDLLDTAIRKVGKPGTQTALYDAIYRFCDEKMRGVSGLRALVVITDGDDTYSRVRVREAIEMAQATETMIFAISTKAGFSGVVPGVEAGTVKDSGDKELDQMCQETGGRAFFTGDKLALERAFGRIAKELRSQYIVTYKPTNEVYDGSTRQIDVRLAGKRDGMKVLARRSYKATPRTATTTAR